MHNIYGNKKNQDLLCFFYQKIGTSDPSSALFKATISNSIAIFDLLLKAFGHQISTEKKLFLTQIAASRGYTEIFSEMIDKYFEELYQHKVSILHTLSINKQDQLKEIFQRKESAIHGFGLPSLDRLKEILWQQTENEPSDTLMMHLVIKSIEMPVQETQAYAPIQAPAVKIEKVKTPPSAKAIEKRTPDLLLKAKQIVGSYHCDAPDSLMYYLAQRRIAMEAIGNSFNSEDHIAQKLGNSYACKLKRY